MVNLQNAVKITLQILKSMVEYGGSQWKKIKFKNNGVITKNFY